MGNKIKSGLWLLGTLVLFIGGLYGYTANIVSLVSENESVGMMIGRVIGIFAAPIGVLLGYF